jgi:tuftelin-interacting protein 11
MRLPEIRHNLRLITNACQKDVDDFARDAKASDERKRYIEQEDILLRKKINEEAQRTLDSSLHAQSLTLPLLVISRLQQVHLVADEIVTHSKELLSTEDASLESFSPLFSKLLEQCPGEFDLYHLDELVIAAIAPLVRIHITFRF